MKNLVGPDGLARWPGLLRNPEVVPHWYGKSEARPGRKLGHANRLLPHGSLSTLADEAALKGL
jgi:5-(carboxyamino)imidazole ribonucleotide synthase